MQCPSCSARLNAWHILSAQENSFRCPNCGRTLRVRGRWGFVLAPMLIGFILPLFFVQLLPDIWFVIVTSLAMLVLYLLSYLVFVRVEQ